MRRRRATLVLLLVVAGCSKLPAPTTSTVPVTINTGDCAVVVTNPRASQTMRVDNHCTVHEELIIIKDLFTHDFVERCGYYYPKQWQVIEHEPEFSLRMEPPRGSYFSKYHFVYETQPSNASWYQDLFLNAEILEYDRDVRPVGVSMTPAQFAWFQAQRQDHPEMFLDPWYLDETVNTPPGSVEAEAPEPEEGDPPPERPAPRTKIGVLTLNGLRQFEDGEEQESEQVPIYQVGQSKLVEVVWYPYVDPYPDMQSEARASGDYFSCQADVGMDKNAFAELCAGLIERTTLSHNSELKSKCFDRE